MPSDMDWQYYGQQAQMPQQPQGLLGALTPQDRMLGLGLLGLSMLGGNYGRNKTEAFTNALQSGLGTGMQYLQFANEQGNRKKALEQRDQAMRQEQSRFDQTFGLQQRADARAQSAVDAQEAERQRVQALMTQLQGLPTTRTVEQRVPAIGPVADPSAMRSVEQQVPLSAEERITQALPILSQINPLTAYQLMGTSADRQAGREERAAARKDQHEFQATQAAAARQQQFDLQRQRAEDQRSLVELQRQIAAASRQPTPAQFLQDEQGRYFAVDPRNPGAAATPVTIPGGQQLSKPTGTNHLTEGEGKGTAFLGQMLAANDQIAKIEKGGFKPQSVLGQIGTNLASGWTNPIAPADAQQYRQAQDQWAEAYLRIKTGAAATEAEVKRNVATFFPRPGDSQAVIDQKRQMREQAENDVRFIAGRGAPQLDAQRGASQQPAGARNVDIDALIKKYGG